MSGKVFVTGATGQIGVPLVRALVADGAEVHALVRPKSPGAAAVREAGARIVEGSLADARALEEGIRGSERIFHLAGGVRGPGGITPDVLNREGTAALVEAIRRVGTAPVVVFASTCAVYGDRSGLWVTEDYPPSPATEYGKSKVAAEELLLASGLPVRIARVGAVYGPGLRFLQVEQMRAGRAWLPGEGKNHIPVVHIDDCVGALLKIAAWNPGSGPTDRIVHVVGKPTPTLRELYTAVHARAGGTPVRFWSTWIPSAFQFRAAALNERLQARVGAKPRFTADNLRLFTASVRLRTERLEKEVGYAWRWPDLDAALDASV